MNEIEKILEECRDKLDNNLCNCKLLRGNSENKVYLIDNRYIFKIMDKRNCWKENYFLNQYKNSREYEHVIYYEEDKNYIVYEYIQSDGIRNFNNINATNYLNDISEIIKKYKSVKNKGYGDILNLKKSWKSFLLNEIERRKRDIIDTKKYIKVSEFISKLDKYEFEKKLLHGDLGDYNILYKEGKIYKIIDPRVLIGDSIYDLVFFVYSNIELAENISVNEILQVTKQPYEKVITYIYIVLYIRISIEKKHQEQKRVRRFEKLWEELERGKYYG